MSLMSEILLKIGRGDCRFWRNNVGQYRKENGAVIRYGVCNPGGSDYIGFKSIEITPSMVGCTVAVFAAVEVKAPRDTISPEQAKFLHAVRMAGGIVIVARSADQAAAELADWRPLPPF